MTKISFEEFVEKYEPEINKFNEEPDEAPYGGFMFETYGEELGYAMSHHTKHKDVWTLIEEDGKRFIVYGMKIVNRLGYFITKNLPLNPDIIVDLEDAKSEEETIEERYKKAKEEFEKALKVYKRLKRVEFFGEVLSRIEDKELLDAITAFNPVEAYPQNDVLIYDGYRTWADSIIFKNWNGEEKAVVIDTDGDFDIERISVSHKNDISIFFENEDGDELTDFHPELSCIPHVPELLEEVEVVK